MLTDEVRGVVNRIVERLRHVVRDLECGRGLRSEGGAGARVRQLQRTDFRALGVRVIVDQNYK